MLPWERLIVQAFLFFTALLNMMFEIRCLGLSVLLQSVRQKYQRKISSIPYPV